MKNIYVLEKFDFDRVVFIPAFKPPHKDLKNFDAENAITQGLQGGSAAG